MLVTSVKIENFRAHSNTEIPLNQLGCLIGENNAGKSTVLHAIQFVLEERKLTDDDFHDSEEPVKVELTIEQIDDYDLERVSSEHRDRVREIIRQGAITIVRQQWQGEKPQSLYMDLQPKEISLRPSSIKKLMKGKKGAALREAAVQLIPEIDKSLKKAPTQKDIVDAANTIVAQLPEDQLVEVPTPYPTGISQAVKPLFPSVIYIEAVKDATVETKTTGTSTFSKLLQLLFNEVSEEFQDIDDQFEALHQKLNRYVTEDGLKVDNRLPAVRIIESTIERFVQASFPGVSLQMEVPPPTLSMLLGETNLLVNDGHTGSVASKGDGLKRTILFAVLRTYASIKSQGLKADTGRPNQTSPYILLFEEPELYLHPQAQRQLMAALETVSREHQVLVTTHSPGFFRPGTSGFSRIHKTDNGVNVNSVEFSASRRDEYQLITHENNEAAFFADKVVLVEGDSDTFTYPHLAKLINPEWDNVEKNIMFVKIEGKGNIRRYRSFFESFNVPIHVITDIDAMEHGFTQLTNNRDITNTHSKLMETIKDNITDSRLPNGKKIKKITSRKSAKDLWKEAQEEFSAWKSTPNAESARKIDVALNELFSAGHAKENVELLKNPTTAEIRSQIDTVIANLAAENVYVLRRGDLESYCKTDTSTDKVARAINFCQQVTTLEKFRELHGDDANDIIGELQGIFSKIYE
ncbi:ATP-dependent endonuclease [Corynebacterium amycolatum]|uniref:ATP-dependent nuclease n=1 Tax=Corynebacterium amycolatum TaxID=43765 RepID=UPI002119E47F|nr:AAA family ATPase [Corynebacterium amycolatum]MCQ9172442.1 ATP-dependent endonuclease [Corynebacterium amycolatum]